MSIVKGNKKELKVETKAFSDVLWKENKEETKYQKVKVKSNKGTEMEEVKQISKQEEIQECYERRLQKTLKKNRKKYL